MWQVISAQTGQAVKFLKQFIPMTKSCSHVSISKMVKVSSGSTVHLGRSSHENCFPLKSDSSHGANFAISDYKVGISVELLGFVWWSRLCGEEFGDLRGPLTPVQRSDSMFKSQIGLRCEEAEIDEHVVEKWLSRYWPHGGVVKFMTASSRWCLSCHMPCFVVYMMTSSGWNTFRVTGWPIVRGVHGSSVEDYSHKDQWYGALMFSLICAWTNG